MVKVRKTGLDFEVDKLPKSIENVVTGDSFQTIVSLVSVEDLKNVTKKNNWLFNWKQEIKQANRIVYKLTIAGNIKLFKG